MGVKGNLDAIVADEDLRMVVTLLGFIGLADNKGHGVAKSGKGKGFLQAVVLVAPTLEFGKTFGNLV